MNRSNVKSPSQKSRFRKTRVDRAANEAIMQLESRQYMTTIVGYSTIGLTATGFGGTSVAASISDPSVTSTPLVRGSGISSNTTGTGAGTGSANGFGGFNFSNGTTYPTTEAAALAINQYFAFSFTVAAGKTDSLTELDEGYKVSGTGPATEDVLYTLSGAKTASGDLGAVTLRSGTASTTGTAMVTAVATNADLQNIPGGTTVTFQIVPYNATGMGGTYNVYNTSSTAPATLDVSGSAATASAQTVALNTASVSVAESAGSVSLTVTRTPTSGGDSSGTLTVPYSTANGTAVSGTNYTGTTTGSVTFGPNVLTQTITVPVLPSNPQGGNKTFTITLGTPTLTGDTGVSGLISAPGAATITIVDTAAVYGFAYSSYSVNETEGTAEITVTRTGYITDSATVSFNTSDGTAVNGTNYSGVNGGTVNFAANQSTASIAVNVNDVSNQGGNKTFNVTLTGVSPATGDYGNLSASATSAVTIVDSSALIGSLTGTASVTSDIETSGPYNAGFGAVNGDSSGAGSFGFASYEVLDFNNASSPSVYPAGTSTLNSLTNLSVEFYNTVAQSTGGTYAAHPGDLNIYYEPDATTAVSTLTYNTSTATGVDSSQYTSVPVLLGTVSFSGATTGYDTYTPIATPPMGLLTALNARSPFRLLVSAATQGVGATSADFAAAAGGLGGASELPIVSISGTLSVQPESFNISSTSNSVSLGTTSVPVTFDRSATSGTPSDAATATYTLVDGTAHTGSDYSGTGGTVYFAPGASAATVNIALLDNTATLGDRTFTVKLTGATTGPTSVGEVGSPTSEVITITDSRTTDISETANNIATVQVPGPATSTSYFTIESSNTANGTFASFAVADFNPASLNGQTVGTVNSATLDLVNTVASFAAAGTLDVYIVDNTSTSLSSTGLTYNTSSTPEGVAGQLGNQFLLGTINYSPSPTIPAGQYTGFSLTNPAGLAELKLALNNGSDIRIVVTAEDAAVAARFVGFDLAAVQYPTLMLNYTPYVAGSLPAYLDPASQATYNSANNTVTVTGPTTFIADPGTSAPNVIASGTAATISFNTTSGSQIHLTSLNLSSGAVATENNPSTRPVVLEIAANGLSIDSTSTLDIGTGDVDVSGGSLAVITALAARGFNYTGGANWNGTGITSSAAAANTKHLTAVGVISDPATGTFDGDTSAVAGDILVKYTYFGDANLSGKVDGSDYSLIDAGYAADKAHAGSATGWYNGDFNYDGTVDGSDYALIDNAFNSQATPITFTPSVLVAAATAQVAAVAVPVSIKTPALVAPKVTGKIARPVVTSAARIPTLFSTGPGIAPAGLDKKAKSSDESLFDSLTA